MQDKEMYVEFKEDKYTFFQDNIKPILDGLNIKPTDEYVLVGEVTIQYELTGTDTNLQELSDELDAIDKVTTEYTYTAPGLDEDYPDGYEGLEVGF